MQGNSWDRTEALGLLVGELARFLGTELPARDRDDGIRLQLTSPEARMVAFCGLGIGDDVQMMAIEARWTASEATLGGGHCQRLTEQLATEQLTLLEQTALQHPTMGTLAETEFYQGRCGAIIGATWLLHHPDSLKQYYKEWWDEDDVRVLSVVLGRDVEQVRAEVAKSLAPPRINNWRAG